MAKKSALVLGIIFILVGILGFVPGNGIVGEGALFEAGTVHNIVHLILGIILVWVASKASQASATALIWVGIIYLIVAALGFAWGSVLGIFEVNGADNWLHLVLGIVLLALGLAGRKASAPAPMSPTPQM